MKNNKTFPTILEQLIKNENNACLTEIYHDILKKTQR